MSQGPASGVVTKALVTDTAEPKIDGSIQPLSLTNDGRLRVSVLAARIEQPWFSEAEEMMWGELEPDYTFSGSPWGVW